MKKQIVVRFMDGHVVTRDLTPGRDFMIAVQATAVRDTEEDFLTVKIDGEYFVIAPMAEIKYFYVVPGSGSESFMEGIDRITGNISETVLKDTLTELLKNYPNKDNKADVGKMETQFALPPDAVRRITGEG